MAAGHSNAILVFLEDLLVAGKILVGVFEGDWPRVELATPIRLVVLTVVVHLLQLVVHHGRQDAQEGTQDHVVPVGHEADVATCITTLIFHALATLETGLRLRHRGC